MIQTDHASARTPSPGEREIDGRLGEHEAAWGVEPSGDHVQGQDEPLGDAAGTRLTHPDAAVGHRCVGCRELARQSLDRLGIDTGMQRGARRRPLLGDGPQLVDTVGEGCQPSG